MAKYESIRMTWNEKENSYSIDCDGKIIIVYGGQEVAIEKLKELLREGDT